MSQQDKLTFDIESKRVIEIIGLVENHLGFTVMDIGICYILNGLCEIYFKITDEERFLFRALTIIYLTGNTELTSVPKHIGRSDMYWFKNQHERMVFLKHMKEHYKNLPS
jgi:hypothetical protein